MNTDRQATLAELRTFLKEELSNPTPLPATLQAASLLNWEQCRMALGV